MKSLHNTDTNTARSNVKDIVFWGGDCMWQLICKASSENEGWMKSTKAMDVGNGCLVQVTTQQKNEDGSYAIAEAVTFVPNVEVFAHLDDNEKIIAREIVPYPAQG